MPQLTTFLRNVTIGYNKFNGKVKKGAFFVDSLRVYVRGGGGGQGLPRYGGIGGEGGSVYVVADDKQSLIRVAKENPVKRFVGGPGSNSSQRKLLGNCGTDVNISVPVGVTVQTDSGYVLGELNTSGQKLLVARGGMGGNPDNRFQGLKGHTEMITLDLKLIADIGLVGICPCCHAGISQMTDGKPGKNSQISVADLPGLIEGAHVNIGLGHRFLKHVERTKLLLFYVDVNGFQLSHKWPQRSAFETVMLLNKELELYKSHLLDKPAVLAINKVDSESERELAQRLSEDITALPGSLKNLDPQFVPENLVNFDKIVPISAKHGHGLSEIKQILRETLDYHAEKSLLSREVGLTEDDGRFRSREKTHTKLV